MARVVGLNREQLATRERVFDDRVAASIRRALRAISFRSVLTAATTLSDNSSEPNPTIPAGALGVVTTTWTQAVDVDLFPYLVETFVAAAANVYDAMPETSGVAPPK